MKIPDMRRQSLIACATLLFFLCLTTQSLSVPISSAADSDHHMTSIWCAWGEKPGMCENRIQTDTGTTVDVPFFVQMCEGRPITEWRRCEEVSEHPKMQNLRTSSSEAKNLYYIIMRVFASENVTRSILLIRLVNSLMATLIVFFILKVARGRLLTAAFTGITFVFVPLTFSQLVVATPKSWAVLGAMFSWVFLYSALYQRAQRPNHRLAWLAYGLCMFLVLSTRIDATYFALFSSIIIVSKPIFELNSKSLWKVLAWAIPTFGLILLLIKQLGRFGAYIAFPKPRTELPFINYIFSETVQIFETSASVFGFGTSQAGGSPGIIGIISFSLFSLVLGTSMASSTRLQFRAVLMTSAFLAFTVYRGNNAIGPQLPGTYILAIPLMLIGFAVLFAKTTPEFMFTKNGRRIIISLLSIANGYVLFGDMEYYVRKGVDAGAYLRLSLDGGWWWNTPISPNLVFLIGVAAFPAFLSFAWRVVDDEEKLFII
jgi:hypothetical protein